MIESDPVAVDFAGVLERLVATQVGMEAGGPWPLAAEFGHTPEASWGPPEILAHCVEMVPYWQAEFDRVAAGAPDGSPVPFGRVPTDTRRIDEIERLRTLPVAELHTRLRAACATFLATWRAWTDADRSRVGLHPVRGELNVEAATRRMIVGHLAEHADQLEALVSPSPPG